MTTSIFPPENKSRRPTMTILIGESGSGKSTLARKMVDADQHKRTIRVNRDEIRSMFHLSSSKRDLEKLVIGVQFEILDSALNFGYDVIVDDTNLNVKTQDRLERLAETYNAHTVRHRMTTPRMNCILNDSYRAGKARVGRAVIERQFLAAGNLPTLGKNPLVIVDIDGTLAQNTVHRSPYDESKVSLDPVYPEIAQWVRDLSFARICEGNPDRQAHRILIVSGRHSTCGDDTVKWLHDNSIPFDHIFMRHGWDNRPDTVVKKEILDEILKNTTKDKIKFVIDDRPSVLNMWFDNGIKIYPAREVKEPF